MVAARHRHPVRHLHRRAADRVLPQRSPADIQDGDGIILCNAKPSWVEGGKPESKAYATLDYFITVVLGKKQDQVRLMLAGDQHHYVRYTEGDATASGR